MINRVKSAPNNIKNILNNNIHLQINSIKQLLNRTEKNRLELIFNSFK